MIARIFRPAFTVRRSLMVLGMVVAGLVFPAVSMGGPDHAAAHRAPPCIPHPAPNQVTATCQITTKAIHKGKQGFELTLNFIQGMPTGYGGRYASSVASILVKKSNGGHTTETDNYAFSGAHGHPVTFKPGNKSLSSATLKTKSTNGDFSINMTFHATGKAVHVRVPRGCTGNGGERRPGKFSGHYTLKADKLGKMTQTSFKATLSTASYTCNKPMHGYDVQTTKGNPYVDFFKGPKLKVNEEIDVSGGSKGWAFDHKYFVGDQPGSDYTLNNTKTLNKATVTGSGGISGTAKYSSKHRSSQVTYGNMSGSLAVTFASIGKVTAFPKPRSASQSRS